MKKKKLKIIILINVRIIIIFLDLLLNLNHLNVPSEEIEEKENSDTNWSLLENKADD